MYTEYSYELHRRRRRRRIFGRPQGNDSDSCYSTVYHLIRLYIEEKERVEESEEKDGTSAREEEEREKRKRKRGIRAPFDVFFVCPCVSRVMVKDNSCLQLQL